MKTSTEKRRAALQLAARNWYQRLETERHAGHTHKKPTIKSRTHAPAQVREALRQEI